MTKSEITLSGKNEYILSHLEKLDMQSLCYVIKRAKEIKRSKICLIMKTNNEILQARNITL